MQNNKTIGRRKKYNSTAIIGAIFIVFAIIGIITVIVSGFSLTTKILDNTKEKEKFEKIILPVLMLDPVPFDDVSQLDELTILRSSIWSALRDKKQTYSYDDVGNVIVPQSDVDVYAVQLFGKNVKIQHQSFNEGILIKYIYDKENMVYKIPIDAQIGYYIPKVEEINKKGDVYSLLVGYVPPGNGWSMSLSGGKYPPTPDKYMIYELKEFKGYYQLIGIKDPPNGAVPGIPEQSHKQEDKAKIPEKKEIKEFVPDDKKEEEDITQA